MVTDELIKKEFIHTILTRDINRIYDTQEKVISENLQSVTGNLLNFTKRRPVTIQGDGLKPTYIMRVLKYLRFLDIKYRGDQMQVRRNLSLYNRVIWGVIYNETVPDLRSGFTQQVKNLMRNDFEKIGRLSSGTIDKITD